jgi:thiol-disulfide isomerase/thioredoxin
VARVLPLVLLAIVSGITGFLAYHGLGGSDPDAAPAEASVELAPAFALPDVDGRVRSSEEWDGKVRIVNFWATWCPPCRREIPLLVDIQREFAPRNVQVIGIAIDETEAVTEFAARIPFNFPVLVGQQEAVDLANAYLPDFIGLPFTAFADRDGRIVHVHTGELHREQIETILGGLL